jgi:hypothetical protein
MRMSQKSKSPVEVLVGMSVTNVSIAGITQIQFGTPPDFVLKCESEVALETESGTFRWNGVFPNENRKELQLLVGANVRMSRVSDVGQFEIVFDNGMKLLVLPNAQFEAWQLVGPKGFMIVSLAGGRLTEWKPID